VQIPGYEPTCNCSGHYQIRNAAHSCILEKLEISVGWGLPCTYLLLCARSADLLLRLSSNEKQRSPQDCSYFFECPLPNLDILLLIMGLFRCITVWAGSDPAAELVRSPNLSGLESVESMVVGFEHHLL
jgi:hypothetical protein